jgi:hypothetical protein
LLATARPAASLARHQQRAEETFGKARVAENFFDHERATRHVRGVLQDAGVPRHQAGRHEAKDLPERKIPRHDRKHDAERPVGDEAFGGVGFDFLAREKLLRILREIIATGGAFLRLGDTVADRLSHFLRHQVRELLRTLAQEFSGGLHRLSALGKAFLAPVEEGGVRPLDDARDFAAFHLVIGSEFLASGRIDGGEVVSSLRGGGSAHGTLLWHAAALKLAVRALLQPTGRDFGSFAGALMSRFRSS